MKNQLMQSWKFNFTWFKFLMVILLVLGVFFRFANLDQKIYWYDETYTSLRVPGYTETELVQQVSNNKVISVEDLQKYQHLNPEKGLTDTVRTLALEDPQHPPLYYVMARFWAQWFGTSVTAMRSLPALISLLAFPCIYWLCLELFESPFVGWMAVALIAVSPFHLLYAQEARQYSLWMVTILLSSAALLRARRVKTKVSWVIYAVTLAANFYTFLFSVLVAIAQGIYLVAVEKFRFTKTLISYLVASILGSLAFLPWLLIVLANFSKTQTTTAWADQNKSFLLLLRNWVSNLSRLFLDVNHKLQSPLVYLIPIGLAILLGSILVGYSLYFLCRHTPQKVWLFILTLIGVTALPLMLSDVILGGVRSNTPRYLIPAYLGIQIAVAYLLATKITNTSVKIWQQKLWQVVMITLFSCGVLSCVISFQAEVWWNKIQNIETPAVARIINQATRPLLISDAELGDILSLSHRLNPKVQLLLKLPCYSCNANSELEPKPYVPKIPEGFSDVFLFKPRPTNKWLDELEKDRTYKKQSVSQGWGKWVWKIEK